MWATDPAEPPARFAGSGEQLHEAASAALGGWADFAPDAYLRGLDVLLQSMDYDPRWTEAGRRRGWATLVSVLAARGHAIRSMSENPGFEQTPLKAPIVITGIPRTGTTALHKLLAVDSQFQGLETWLTGAPQPRPAPETWEANPAFQATVAQLESRNASKPGIRAAHDMAAEEVDECCLILRQGFVSNLWTCGWSAMNYDLWWQGQTDTGGEQHCYDHLARVLKLIGSTAPDKRWLLKNPGHVDNLDTLFTTFPDALVIQTHRDPAKAIPSLAAMLIGNHAVFEEGRVDERRLLTGWRETEKWARAIRRTENARRARPSQILDVIHTDFHGDPMGTVERIYAFAGLTLTDAVRAAMAERIEARPEAQHGTHKYDLADFGLTAEGVRERFGDYVERFDLVEKKKERAA